MKTDNVELLRKRVIELIHGLPYEKAIEKEIGFGCLVRHYKNNPLSVIVAMDKENSDGLSTYLYSYIEDLHSGNFGRLGQRTWSFEDIIGKPIDISRIMQALANKYGEWHMTAWGNGVCRLDKDIGWKLLKDDFSTATIEEQTPETISKLLTLLK